MKNRKVYRDAIKHMDSVIGPKRAKRAEARAQREAHKIRLAELRKLGKLTQSQVKGFTQVEVSKIENREDMKVSTLIRYVQGLGADIKIIASLKDGDHGLEEEITLLKAVGE